MWNKPKSLRKSQEELIKLIKLLKSKNYFPVTSTFGFCFAKNK